MTKITKSEAALSNKSKRLRYFDRSKNVIGLISAYVVCASLDNEQGLMGDRFG